MMELIGSLNKINYKQRDTKEKKRESEKVSGKVGEIDGQTKRETKNTN